MNTSVVYTDNFQDISTEQAFQWEFYCERCGKAYQSTPKSSKVGAVGAKASQGLGGMFGGRLSKVASQGSSMLENTAGAKEKEKAFPAAVYEVQNRFNECPQCAQWVCDDDWNSQLGVCTQCAPMVAQGEGVCPSCNARTEPGAKFCPSCGGKLAGTAKCASCSTESPEGTKFCPECGNALT
ncbi:MAG TPA: zinc ribbon domain-containing protein [Chloroflexota bacterium]|nr:zinc ribbon domain-containing protein [Chloroflexota bacterium]